MLELKHIYKTYNAGTVNEQVLFSDFNISIPEGDFVSVVGSNGSGKTSMLNLICGTIQADSGQIIINETEDPAKGTCPSMNILENLSIADNKGKFYGLSRGTNKARIEYYKDML